MAKAAARIRAKKSAKKSAPKDASAAGPKCVSAAELGAILANPPFSARWLAKLAEDGVIVKAGRGQYDLAGSVQGYLRFKVETELARKLPDETPPGERVKAERARKLKLENDEKELRLVHMSSAIAALDAIVGPLMADLAGVPARVTDDVALRRRIEDANDAVLRGLADRFKKAGRNLRAGRDPLQALEEDDA